MRKRQAPRKFNDFDSFGVAYGVAIDDFSQAMRQRQQQAQRTFLTTEHLSAEPRGNEIDLRKRVK